MSVLFIVGPRCTLAASHAAYLVSHGEYAAHERFFDNALYKFTFTLLYFTLCRRDRRQTVTLCFPLDSASITVT